MSPNSYLERLAANAIPRELEKVNIERSFEILRSRLEEYFDRSVVAEHFAFGSYTRGTMLPRIMDSQSDVDYMILFADSDSKPQTCLDRLRRFADKYYPESEIAQSHPTILLSLNHIRFELVPAIKTWWDGTQIPSKGSGYSEWIGTSPNEFNRRLSDKNKDNQNRIKPLARLVKYWNACNEYQFESFQLETWIVEHWTFGTWLFGGTLWERFRDFIDEMDPAADTDRKKEVVLRAQRMVQRVAKFESDGKHEDSEKELQRLLPCVEW